MKSKLKSHRDEVTDFYNKEIPKADSSYTCLAAIDSALIKDENYYPQLLSRDYKYIKKEAIRYIIDALESCFDDFDDSNKE